MKVEGPTIQKSLLRWENHEHLSQSVKIPFGIAKELLGAAKQSSLQPNTVGWGWDGRVTLAILLACRRMYFWAKKMRGGFFHWKYQEKQTNIDMHLAKKTPTEKRQGEETSKES